MTNVSDLYIEGKLYGQISNVSQTNTQDNVQSIVIGEDFYANENKGRHATTLEITYPNDSDLFTLFNELANDVDGSYSKTLNSNAVNFGGGLQIKIINTATKKITHRFTIGAVVKVEPNGALYDREGSVDVVMSKVTINGIKHKTIVQ